jgi:hypothetical protein
MKKLLTIAFLVIGMISNAQKKDRFTVSISIDPSASIKEKSINIMPEIEYYRDWFYIKGTMQFLPALNGGYIDYGGAGGINIIINKVEETRVFAGVRLGVIRRGGNPYPMAGIEAGINKYLNEQIFIGAKFTVDKREDFKYWGGDPINRFSGYVTIGIKLN